MKTSSLIWISIIIVLIICLVVFAIWVNNLTKPTHGVNCKTKSDWKWDDSCSYFQELEYDPTISSPSGVNLNLLKFEYSTAGGSPMALPMWYRFRYVNVNTGKYSDFSNWTPSAVQVGSTALPYPSDIQGTSGRDTCKFNKPTIGILADDAAYNLTSVLPDGSFIYMNIHRYVNKDITSAEPPSSTVQDEIIGYLIPQSISGNKYYVLIDVLHNPEGRGRAPGC